MKTVNMSGYVFSKIDEIAQETLQDLKFKIDDWQDTYDERESNEPEYDSQIERWQDALDRLEDKIDALTDVVDDYEDWADDLDVIDANSIDGASLLEIDEAGLLEIIERLKSFNQEYRGISKIIKEIEKIAKTIKICEVKQ